MKWVEVSENLFVNLNLVTDIFLVLEKEKYRWVFSFGDEDFIKGKSFDSEKEAREWLKNNILNGF